MIRGGKAYRQSKGFKQRILVRDGYTCQSCGGHVGEYGIRQLDVAHIKPYSECGSTTPDNMQVLCHSCNLRDRGPMRNAAPTLDSWWAKLEALDTV